MSSNKRLQPKDESSWTASQFFSRMNRRNESTAILTSTQELSGQGSSSGTRKKEPVVIRCPDYVECVAFLIDGEHIVSGDSGGKMRRWRVDNGSKVGKPMDAGSAVCSMAVSRDGKWLVNGTGWSGAQVWSTEMLDKVREIGRHVTGRAPVYAVDLSQDTTRIATGSDDDTVHIWSLRTGKQVFDAWRHSDKLAAAKFSPDGRLVATATWNHKSVRVYDEHARCLFDVAIQVGSFRNNSLAWSADGERLFALAHNGVIYSINASTGKILSRWAIHGTKGTKCIALASNGMFIVTSAGSSLSFWDATTQEQIGTVIQLDHEVWSLAMSNNHNLATGGEKVVSLHNLEPILPLSYLADTRDVAKVGSELFESKEKMQVERDNRPPSAQEGNLGDNSARLENVIEQLRHELALSQRVTEEKDELLLRANDQIMQLEQANEKLHSDLATATSSFQISENQEKYEKEIERWKSSYTAQENELATTLEAVRRNQSQSVQPSPPEIRCEAQPNVHYGVACAVPADVENEEHIQRKEQWETDPTGECYVSGFFESKVHVGAGPHEDKVFRDAFSLIRDNPSDFAEETVRIVCYRASFSVLCTIRIDLSKAMRDLVMKMDESGGVYYQLDYDLIVSFGRTDIHAEVCWTSGTGERRVPARITFED